LAPTLNSAAKDGELLRQEFLRGMSRAAATVNVITTDGPAGRAGVTVSAMTSVSADGEHPVLLACIHHLSPASQAILANGVFCVNVLRDDQSFIADTFAGRIEPPGDDKFSCTSWTVGITGSPKVHDPLVVFDCKLFHELRVGTHHVIIGKVVEAFVQGDRLALIYANRAYGSPTRLDSQMVSHQRPKSSNLLRIGSFFTVGPAFLPELIAKFVAKEPRAHVSLVDGHQGQVLEALRTDSCDVVLTYGMHLDRGFATRTLTTLAPYVLLADDHPLATRPRLPLAELVKLPLILLETPPSKEYFLGLFHSQGLAPNIWLRTGSFEMVRGLVGQGLGYSILATRPGGDASYDGHRLACVEIEDRVAHSLLVLVHRTDRPLRGLARTFAEICTHHFAEAGHQKSREDTDDA